MSEPAPLSFGHLATYLEHGIGSVQGWLSPTTASMIAQILVEQTKAGLQADVCEIGVHHGRLFLILANAAAPGETAVAVDVFADQDKNLDQSGAGDRAVFERHVAHHAPDAAVEVIQESSLNLAQLGFQSRRFRFMSIDGGHTAATVANDLHLAETTLVAGGVAALDDILSHVWTGVLSGLSLYLAAGGTLRPCALTPNKLLLTTSAASAVAIRANLLARFPKAVAKRGLEFLGGEVDSYDEHPAYGEANTALRLARDGLAAALDSARAEAEALRRALAATNPGEATLVRRSWWRA